MTYVVVVIETESDFPGIAKVVGPFTHYEDASSAANEVAAATSLKRGEHVQVSTIVQPEEVTA
jgi:hypothetical protein